MITIALSDLEIIDADKHARFVHALRGQHSNGAPCKPEDLVNDQWARYAELAVAIYTGQRWRAQSLESYTADVGHDIEVKFTRNGFMLRVRDSQITDDGRYVLTSTGRNKDYDYNSSPVAIDIVGFAYGFELRNGNDRYKNGFQLHAADLRSPGGLNGIQKANYKNN